MRGATGWRFAVPFFCLVSGLLWLGSVAAATADEVTAAGTRGRAPGVRTEDRGREDQRHVRIGPGDPEVASPVTRSPLSTDPDWSAESDRPGVFLGRSVARAGDVNGDGYDDVIVGAPYDSNGEYGEGRAFLYRGSFSGLESTPAWTGEGDQDDARFGWSVATAGDVNGDGYDDVIVGAPELENPYTQGRAFVYLGSSSGLEAAPAWTAEASPPGDGWEKYGWSVASAGDVNGDGYDDVIVGAPRYVGNSSEGAAFVYLGSGAGLEASPSWIAEGSWYNSRFGHTVGTAGDVNGDGYDDVLIGARGHDVGNDMWGSVFLYAGTATGLAPDPAWSASGAEGGEIVGVQAAPAGDVNGDGYDDVILGGHYGPDDDWCGGFGGRSCPVQGQACVNDPGSDCDFDDCCDCPGRCVDEGRAFVYHGSASGLGPTPAWMRSDRSLYGSSLGTAGDIDGDGYADVIVSGGNGRAMVYQGSDAGLELAPVWVTIGTVLPVATAGDVNGDGSDDVILGEPRYRNPEQNEGRALVHHGPLEACGDGDGDGYGDPGSPVCPAGPETDCDDADPAVHPDAVEVCDGVDNDCDGDVDGSLGFSLSAPADDALVYPDALPYEFAWCPGDMGRFKVIWSRSAGFGKPRSSSGKAWLDGVETHTPGTSRWLRILRLGKRSSTVHWMVRGRDDSGNLESSAARTFRVAGEAAPVLTAPPDDWEYRIGASPPTLTWETNHNAVYRVVFSTRADVLGKPRVTSGKGYTLTGSSWTVPEETWGQIGVMLAFRSQDGRAYYAVFAKDALGRKTRSPIQSFQVVP